MNIVISYAITTLCILGIIFVCIQIVNLIGYIFKPKKCDGTGLKPPKPWEKPPCIHRYVSVVSGPIIMTEESQHTTTLRIICDDCGKDVTDEIDEAVKDFDMFSPYSTEGYEVNDNESEDTVLKE